MKTLLTPIFLSKLCLIVFGALLVVQTVKAESIKVQCVSASGQSVYDLELDTKQQNGEIRYRFMQQDVFYSVLLDSKDTGSIAGIAQFKGSLSGEIRGSSFAFTYEKKKKMFSENNLQASCD